jgi:hypothetical protein
MYGPMIAIHADAGGIQVPACVQTPPFTRGATQRASHLLCGSNGEMWNTHIGVRLFVGTTQQAEAPEGLIPPSGQAAAPIGSKPIRGAVGHGKQFRSLQSSRPGPFDLSRVEHCRRTREGVEGRVRHANGTMLCTRSKLSRTDGIGMRHWHEAAQSTSNVLKQLNHGPPESLRLGVEPFPTEWALTHHLQIEVASPRNSAKSGQHCMRYALAEPS